MTGTYRLLEDIAIADVAFEAVGATPGELCETAGRAVVDLMANPSTVGTGWTQVVVGTADTLGELLYEWLNRLVYLKDAHAVLFHDVDVQVTEQGMAPRWRLQALVRGAPVDPSIQELRADIKAVTKHLYEVSQDGSGWRARVVLDV